MFSNLRRALRLTLYALLAALVVVVSWQVLSRYVLSSPAVFTEELSRVLLMWLGVLGGAFVLAEKKHLAIILFDESLSDRARRIRHGAILLLQTILAAALLMGGYELVQNAYTLGQKTPTLGWSMGTVYLCVPLSAILMIAFLAEDVWNSR